MEELLAHFDKKTGRKQTLKAHCTSVGAYCAVHCKELGLESLGQLIGELHDSGKATQVFQKYLVDGDQSQRGKINHSACGARYLADLYTTGKGARGLAASLAAGAICGHHSGPVDASSPRGEDALGRRIYPEKETYYEEAIRNFTEACIATPFLEALFVQAQQEVQSLFERIIAVCKTLPVSSQKSQMQFFLGMVQRYLLSVLIDADCYNTYLFETEQPETGIAEQKAPWEELAQRMEAHLSQMPAVSELDQIRTHISAACLAFAKNGPGIYQLHVPTGGGKTLSSLRFGLHHAAEKQKAHLFYIAPFKTILEQNAGTIRDVLNDDSVLLEHHSDVVIEDADDGEALARYTLLTQRWDVPVILTTMVQFLQTLFYGKKGCVRRFHALANSILLLDEVQAVPVKFVSMMNAALNFLAYCCGCTVILCTATQPALAEVPVPVLPGNPPQMAKGAGQDSSVFDRVKLEDLTAKPPFSAQQLAAFTAERLEDADSILVVVNTKDAAQRLFQALREQLQKQDAMLLYLTTALCPAHRLSVLEKIKEQLKRNRNQAGSSAQKPIVCISTQLIEAGVDLSFSCVIRSLAGLDSIAQAAGRCNRNRESPEPRAVYIVKCAEENLSRLPDIVKGQHATEIVLEAFARNAARFGGNLLCAKATQYYYQIYYQDRMRELDYLVSKEKDAALFMDTSLYSLLTQNLSAQTAVGFEKLPQRHLQQAFETAGRIVEVIEKNGRDVIVPYQEGKEIITQLLQGTDLKQTAKLLRKAQRYSVHLFEYQLQSLQKALTYLPDSGVTVLQEEFYDEKIFGLCKKRREMEFLCG